LKKNNSILVTRVPGAGGLHAGYFLNFSGGLKSFYTGMAKSEVKVSPDKDFPKLGGSFLYANPLIHA